MSRPPRLYKYEPFSSQALENLKNQVIYFGSPMQFNDPYDCALYPSIKEPTDSDVEKIRSHYLSNEAMDEDRRRSFMRMPTSAMRIMLMGIGQTVLEDAIKNFTSNKGVSCFAESPESLLMWSHYGSQHRGFCLEFRTDREPFSKIRQVKYSAEMPEFDLVPMLCDREFDQVLDLYCTKALDWEYEREWRCLHHDARTPFTYAGEALTGVYFGARCSFASFEIAALILASQNQHVKLWRGKRSKSEFGVTFDQVTYTPHLQAQYLGESR